MQAHVVTKVAKVSNILFQSLCRVPSGWALFAATFFCVFKLDMGYILSHIYYILATHIVRGNTGKLSYFLLSACNVIKVYP